MKSGSRKRRCSPRIQGLLAADGLPRRGQRGKTDKVAESDRGQSADRLERTTGGWASSVLAEAQDVVLGAKVKVAR